MSYDNTKDWFDEFNPTEAMGLALINKGMKWHKKDKLFEDCYGVYWPEEVVFAIIDKLVHQFIPNIEDRELCFNKEAWGVRPKKISARELMQPPSSLIDKITHLSLEGFNEYLEKNKLGG